MSHIPWTNRELRELASKTIFTRGEAYFLEGCVSDLSFDPQSQEWIAYVSGTQNYEVCISVGTSKPDAFCECPYEGWPCKHIVAVGLALEAHQETLKQEQKQQSHQSNLLNTRLQNLKEKELRELLQEALKHIPDMLPFLELRLLQDTQASLKSIRKKIRLLKNQLERSGSLSGVTREFKSLWKLSQQKTGQLSVLLELLDQGLELIDQYEIYESPLNDFLADALDELIKLHKQYPEWPREGSLDKLMHHFSQGNPLEDNIYDSVQKIIAAESERIQVLQKLQEMARQPRHASSYLNELIADLQGQLGNDAERLAYLEEQLVDGSDYWRLARYWLEKSNTSKAWEVVKQGIEEAEGDKDELYSYALEQTGQKFSALFKFFEQWLADHPYVSTQTVEESGLYQALLSHKQGNSAQFQQQRLYLQLQYLQPDWALYQAAQTQLSASAFQRFERELIQRLESKLTSPNATLWHPRSERIDRVWAHIQFAKGQKSKVYEHFCKIPRALRYFEDELASDYPEAYLKLWQQAVEQEIGSRTRDAYKRAASELKKIRNLLCKQLKDRVRWQNYFNELKQHHTKLRALHDELSKAGLRS